MGTIYKVIIKYALDEEPLQREVVALKNLSEVKDIPKLLYEELGAGIPFIITSMVGQKVTKIDEPTACNMVIDILDILKSIHECNYIYNDIHLGNVVKFGDKYQLIDFDHV